MTTTGCFTVSEHIRDEQIITQISPMTDFVQHCKRNWNNHVERQSSDISPHKLTPIQRHEKL
jgi:hypothetical protein